MKRKAKVISTVLLLLIVVVTATITFVLAGGNMRIGRDIDRFARMVEQGEFDDLVLRIYYMDLSVRTPAPVSVGQLINHSSVDIGGSVTLNGDALQEHAEALRRVNRGLLNATSGSRRPDARIYYIFETKSGDKIFDVVLLAVGDDDILINGRLYKRHHVFFEIILPFLPEDIASSLSAFMVFTE